MIGTETLRVVIVKPSKYAADGYVERFRRGFMPNSTVPYLREHDAGCGGSSAASRSTPSTSTSTPTSTTCAAAPAPGGRTLLAAGRCAEPPVSSGARPRGVRPSKRVHGGHRRAPRDDLRHVDAAGRGGELRAGRGGAGLAGDPARRGRRRTAARSTARDRRWQQDLRRAGPRPAVAPRSRAATSCPCSASTRRAAVRSLQLLLGDQDRRPAVRSQPRRRRPWRACAPPRRLACARSCSRPTTSTSIRRSRRCSRR